MQQTRTVKYISAQKAFRTLAPEDQDAFLHEVVAERNQRHAEARLGKLTTGHICWRRLVGKRYMGRDPIPGDDHVEYRVKNGVGTYISRPYGLALPQIRSLAKHCDDNGLYCVIHPSGWWHAGPTLVVEYTRRPKSEASNAATRGPASARG